MKKNGLPYKSKSGFKIPENYFGEFETRIMGKVNNLKEEDLVSKPFNPFKIPDHYFENLEENIIKTLDKEKKKAKVITLINNKYFSYIAGIAAVFAIIFLSTRLYNRSQSFGFEDLEITAVENYLLQSFERTTPEESHLIKEDDFSFAPSANDNFNREAVLEYLNENMDDPSLLLNED